MFLVRHSRMELHGKTLCEINAGLETFRVAYDRWRLLRVEYFKETLQKIVKSSQVKQISTNLLLRLDWGEDGGYFPWSEFLLFKKLEMLILEQGTQISMQQLVKLEIMEVLYPEEQLLLRGNIKDIWEFLEFKEAVTCEIINLSTEMKNTYRIEETINLHFKLDIEYSPTKAFDILYFRT